MYSTTVYGVKCNFLKRLVQTSVVGTENLYYRGKGQQFQQVQQNNFQPTKLDSHVILNI